MLLLLFANPLAGVPAAIHSESYAAGKDAADSGSAQRRESSQNFGTDSGEQHAPEVFYTIRR
jgi:hypothetical protein